MIGGITGLSGRVRGGVGVTTDTVGVTLSSAEIGCGIYLSSTGIDNATISG